LGSTKNAINLQEIGSVDPIRMSDNVAPFLFEDEMASAADEWYSS
jgi:hypothetical protein